MTPDQITEIPTASEIIKRARRMSLDPQLAAHALDQELVRAELERLIAQLHATQSRLLQAEQERDHAKAQIANEESPGATWWCKRAAEVEVQRDEAEDRYQTLQAKIRRAAQRYRSGVSDGNDLAADLLALLEAETP